MRTAVALGLAFVAAACASAPVAPPPMPVGPTFAEKMAWMLRLEDQRVLRDPAPPPAEPVPPPTRSAPRREGARRDSAAATAASARSRAPAVGHGSSRETASGARRRTCRTDGRRCAARRAAARSGSGGPADGGILAWPHRRSERARSAGHGAGRRVSARAGKRGRSARPSRRSGRRRRPSAGWRRRSCSRERSPRSRATTADSARDTPAAAFRLALFALVRLKAYDQLAAAVLDAVGPAARPVVARRLCPAASRGQARAAGARDPHAGAASVHAGVCRQGPRRAEGRRRGADARRSGPVERSRGHHRGGARARAHWRSLRRSGPAEARDRQRRGAARQARGADGARRRARRGRAWPDGHPARRDDRSGPAIRAAALRSMATVDPQEFFAVLSSLDADADWSVRAALASVLGTLAPQLALPRLSTMLADQDQRVVPAVIDALVKLRAPNLADDPAGAVEGRRSRRTRDRSRGPGGDEGGERRAGAGQCVSGRPAGRHVHGARRSARRAGQVRRSPPPARYSRRRWPTRTGPCGSRRRSCSKQLDPASAADVDRQIRPAPTRATPEHVPVIAARRSARLHAGLHRH